MLLEGEAVLAGGLGRDADEESGSFSELSVEVAPGFEFGDAVGIPAATEEVDDDGAEGEEVGGVDELVGEGVLKGEGRSLRSDLQDAVLDAGIEEVFGRSFRDGETLGLDEGAGVLGDAVETVLQRDVESSSHTYIIAAISVVTPLAFGSWQEMAVAADFVATVLVWLALLAAGELFISVSKVTRRWKPCSRAVLLPGTVFVGSSPARMKP